MKSKKWHRKQARKPKAVIGNSVPGGSFEPIPIIVAYEDIAVSLSQMEKIAAQTAAQLFYPHGREAYVREFDIRFGLLPRD